MAGNSSSGYAIYDCGCVPSRPKDQSCKMYGTRWRVYVAVSQINLKCRDCGRMHVFVLQKSGAQMIRYMDKEEGVDEE